MEKLCTWSKLTMEMKWNGKIMSFYKCAHLENWIRIRYCSWVHFSNINIDPFHFYLFFITTRSPVTSPVEFHFASYSKIGLMDSLPKVLNIPSKRLAGESWNRQAELLSKRHRLFMLLLSSHVQACPSCREGISQRGNASEWARTCHWLVLQSLTSRCISDFTRSNIPETKISVSSIREAQKSWNKLLESTHISCHIRVQSLLPLSQTFITVFQHVYHLIAR